MTKHRGSLLAQEQAEEYTGLSRYQLKRACNRGELACYKPAGPMGPRMYAPEDLDAYLDSCRVPAKR